MNPEFCIKTGKSEINNEHVTCCGHTNSEAVLWYEHLLNGSIQEKVKILELIESNEKKGKEEMENVYHCHPVIVDPLNVTIWVSD